MDKYLQLLLQQENTVIIPDLGALMITNETTQELMFNEYLKFNDGKLHKFIAENSNMDEQEATNFVAKYVREIKADLDKGDTYDMFEFGRFKKKDDKIEFENWNKYNAGAAAPKKSTQIEPATDKVEAKEPVKKAATKKTIEKKPVEKKAAKKPATPKTEKKPEPKVDEKKEEVKNTYVPPVETPKVEEVKAKVEEKVEDTAKTIDKKVAAAATVTAAAGVSARDKVETKKKPKANAKPSQEKKEKKRKGAGFWILLALLLLLGAGGVYYGMNYKKLNQQFGFTMGESELLADNNDANNTEDANSSENNETDLESENENIELDENGNPISETEMEENLDADGNPIEAGEESMEETTEEATEVVEEKVDEVEEVVETVNYGNTSGSFHVIVGGFADGSNAEKLAADLKTKGYGASVVGQFDGLHMVSAQSFNSRDEAKGAMSGIRSGVTESAWIFKYPK